MTTLKGKIRIEYFENFKGEDSILISVDIYGLIELEGLFMKLSEGLTEYDFSKLQYVDTSPKLKLLAVKSEENIGLIQTAPDNYVWKVTNEKWGEFREKLTALYKIGTSGHQYLDSDSYDNKDLQVVLSWNEQAERKWWEIWK